MKKVVRVVSLLALTLCLGLALAACAKEEGKYVGTGPDGIVVVELKDGKYTQKVYADEDDEEPEVFTGTYRVKGSKLYVKIEGVEEEVPLAFKPGKYIEMPGDGGAYKLKYKK